MVVFVPRPLKIRFLLAPVLPKQVLPLVFRLGVLGGLLALVQVRFSGYAAGFG